MIKIEEISYSKPDEARILESCLTAWFQNPKDLNLTSPNMKFPFNFQKWVANNYSKEGIKTYVVLSDGWIIGHISTSERKDRLHIFHVVVDRKFRKKSIGKKLVMHAISAGKKGGFKTISLRVLKGNLPAISLYENLGFKITGTRDSSYEMELSLTS